MRPVVLRAVIFSCGTGLTAGLGGCGGGLAGIDRKTERLISEKSAQAGIPVEPRRTYERSYPKRTAAETRKDIPTTNPPASSLAFTEADPARDVETVQGRLRAQIAEAMALPEGAEPMRFSLFTALQAAQRTGPEYLAGEEEYILAAIRLLIERHRWGPRLFDEITATVSGDGDDGDFRSAVAVVNDLRVTQLLPYGGEVEAGLLWRATEQLRETVGGEYVQSSELVFRGNLPLLRGTGLVAQESLIQAERTLVYRARDFESFRRDYLVSIARDYLSLLQSQARIANQKQRIRSLIEVLRSTEARVRAGRLRQFEEDLARSDLLSAAASLADDRDGYIAQLEEFKVRLGIPVEQPVEIGNVVIDLSEPSITMGEASRRALDYRLDLQNERDQLDDSRRSVANARNNLLPDLNLTGNVGIPTDDDKRVGGLSLDTDQTRYSAGVSLDLPLDRAQQRLALRAAQIALEQAERNYGRFQDSLLIDVRSAVRAVDLARFQLQLAEDRVRANQRRKQEQELRQDETNTQEKLDTENALIDAKNARDDAQVRLRLSVLEYLLATGEMRVTREGRLDPPSGMSVRDVEIFAETPNLGDWFIDPRAEEPPLPAPPP